MSEVLVKLLKSAERPYPPMFSYDTVELWPEEEFRWCVASGLLRRGRPASYVYCYECGDVEEVVFLEDSVTKKLRAYTPCTEVGPVEICLDRIKQWEMTYQQLIDTVFSDVGLSGHREEIVRDRVWQLGKATWGGASRSVFFALGLHRSDAWQIINQGRFTAGSVVFVPAKSPSPDPRVQVWPTIIPLLDVLAWTGKSICFDHAHIESRLAEHQTVTKRPIRKRSRRTATIELLTKHMMDHVKAARDHAYTNCEFDHEAELLPRPTKRELGRLIGVNEVTVGRCFNDSAARELRFLWELAGDLTRLLEYGHAFSA